MMDEDGNMPEAGTLSEEYIDVVENIDYGTEIRATDIILRSGVGLTASIETELPIKVSADITKNVIVVKYTRTYHTLTINPNGGTYSGPGEYNSATGLYTIGVYSGKVITIPDPEKTGHSFKEWVYDTGSFNTSTKEYTVGSNNTTLIATYDKNNYTYKVVYYEMDETGEYPSVPTHHVGPVSAKYGDEIDEGNYTVPTKSGFETKLDSNITLPLTIDVDNIENPEKNVITYYLERNKHTLTIEYGSGTYTGTASSSVYYNQTYNIGSIENKGHTFDGWTVIVGGVEVSTLAPSTTTYVMPDADVILRANYTLIDYTYTVVYKKYDLNGSERVIYTDNHTMNYGDEYTPTPRDERGFTKPSVTKFKLEVENDVTVEYFYTRNEYTLEIDPGGEKATYDGQSGKTRIDILYEDEVTLKTPENSGYTFVSFTSEENNGTITDTVVSGTRVIKFTMSDANDSKIIAAWTANDYNYSVYHNQQNVNGSGYSVVTGDTKTGQAKMDTLLCPDYKSKEDYPGFYVSTANFNETYNKVCIVIDVDKTNPATTNRVDYYYNRETYNISVEMNGGTYNGDSYNNAFYYGATINLGVPTRTGYTFKGWTATNYETGALSGTTSNPSTSWNGSLTTNQYFKNLRKSSGTVNLTANWEANTYNIEYALGGGTSGSNAPTSGTYNSVITIDNPTRTGYTFTGWTITNYQTGAKTGSSETAVTTNVSSTATKNRFFKNLRSSNSSDGVKVKFTANWSAISYTIEYALGSDEASMTKAPTSANYDTVVEISNPTRTGYNFIGWTITNYQTGAKMGSSSTTVTSNVSNSTTKNQFFKNLRSSSSSDGVKVKFTANWQVISYGYSVKHYYIKADGTEQYYTTVNFSAQPYNTTISYDANVHYIEIAGYRTINATPTSITIGTNASSNVMIVKYKCDEHDITVGGTFDVYSQPFTNPVKYGQKVNLGTPTRTGYTFGGWNTTSGSISGNYITIGDGDPTVTPSWTANSYTIQLVYNNGSTNGSVSATYDTAVQITNPTRTGYTFAGWTSSSADGLVTGTYGAKYGENSSTGSYWYGARTTNQWFKNLTTTSSGTVKLTANWQANGYTIEYTLNGGTAGSKAPTSAEYDKVVEISNPTRTGYTFKGWNITGMDSVTHTYGSYTTTATSLSNRKETSYKNLRSTSGTVTFTASWSQNQYSIVYNYNGGFHEGWWDSCPSSAYYDWNIQITNPIKQGYTFTGWTASTSSGLQSDAKYGVDSPTTSWSGSLTTNQWFKNLRSDAGTVTLTANWEINTYDIIYDYKGGSSTTGHNPESAIFNSVAYIATPGKTGYWFTGYTRDFYYGWWHDVYSGAYYDGGSNLSLWSYGTKSNVEHTYFKNLATGNSVKLTANWETARPTIYLDARGGTFSDNSTIKSTLVYYGNTYGSGSLGSLPTPTRKGYTFVGWFEGPGKNYKQITDSTYLYNEWPNQTIYAVWN